MKRFAFLLTAFASLPVDAGYYEYQFLAPSSCLAFSLSSDSVAPGLNSKEVSTEYKAYLAAKGGDASTFWSLLVEGSEGPSQWADCEHSESEIKCTVIGRFKYQTISCRLGQSKAWSRSCTTAVGRVGELMVYSVDTREYELGGSPIVNQYMQADRERFNVRCKQDKSR